MAACRLLTTHFALQHGVRRSLTQARTRTRTHTRTPVQVLQAIGAPSTDTHCRRLIAIFDIDKSGRIEVDEFVTMMMLEHVKEPDR
jgi:EF hand